MEHKRLSDTWLNVLTDVSSNLKKRGGRMGHKQHSKAQITNTRNATGAIPTDG